MPTLCHALYLADSAAAALAASTTRPGTRSHTVNKTTSEQVCGTEGDPWWICPDVVLLVSPVGRGMANLGWHPGCRFSGKPNQHPK